MTSTSLNIVTPVAAAGSAEGASLLREQHVYAVEACRDSVDRSWAEVMATAFAFMGDLERADATQIEPIWGPAERYSLQEKADAASKAATSLPREAIQRDIWQYAPAEVQELRTLTGRDFLTSGAPQVPAPPALEVDAGALDGADAGAAG